MESEGNEVLEAIQEVNQLRRVSSYLTELNDKILLYKKEVIDAESILRKEFTDISQLEKLSIIGLFHKMIGSREEQMEKERQEYLQASLKFDEAKKNLELLEFEQKLLQDKVKLLPKAEEKLKKVIKKREEFIVKNNTPEAKHLLDLVHMIDSTGELIQSINSVKKNGSTILLALEKMLSHLQKAKNWGQWGPSGRHGRISYLKHNEVDTARELSYHIKHQLIHFQKDVRQIFGRDLEGLHIELGDFSHFTDIFVNNLISDWIVQQKIHHALANVSSVRDKISQILESMETEVNRAKERIQRLEEERQKLIIQS